SVTDLVSVEREPSRDPSGSTEGALKWYAYGASGNPHREPTEPMVGCEARVLPNGETQFQCTDSYSTSGFPVSQRESYTKADGSVGVLSNWFAYPFNSPDLTSASNSFGQSMKLAWNGNHQVTFTTNALA